MTVSVQLTRQPGQSLGLSASAWRSGDAGAVDAARFRMALQAIVHQPENMDGAKVARAIAMTALEDA